MSERNIIEWLEVCKAAAHAGGQELLARRGGFTSREKGRSDLVTDADLASQAAIREVIAARFPEHVFIGEEQSGNASAPLLDQPTWIVDTLDGTTNYVHGYPH